MGVALSSDGRGGAGTCGGRASLFDLGIYAGGAYTTDWFEVGDGEGDDQGWGPGPAPQVGVSGTYWTSPTFGGRVGLTYMPSNFAPSDFPDDKVSVWYVDLAAVVRPASDSLSLGRPLARPYFFGGPTLIRASPDGGDASNGFGAHLGAGTTFSPLGPTLTPFAEVRVRGYPSPFDNQNDKFAVGGELTLGIDVTLRY